MTLATQAAFAARHGVSRKTVTIWKQDGRLVLVDGQVDVEASDARVRDAGLGRFKDEEPAAPAPLPPGNSRGNTPAEADPDPAAFLENLLAGRYATQAEAERIKENALAGRRVLELQQEAGVLVPLELAQTVFFSEARAERDAWLNWPSRIGPRLAATLGVPADTVTEALTRYVHEELDGRGEPEPDFTRGEG